jgi:valyl-tRNA synthetase
MQQARNFANKIWNAARFVLTQSQDIDLLPYNADDLDLSERWILSRLHTTIAGVTSSIESYQFEAAASTLYAFVWGDFCDWFVEESKPKLRDGDEQRFAVIAQVLEVSMRLLHPFMPFLSEEIWQKLPKASSADSLCVAPWPGASTCPHDAGAERQFTLLQDAVQAARRLKAEAKLPLGQKVPLQFFAPDSEIAATLAEHDEILKYLSGASEATVFESSAPRPANAISSSLPLFEVFLPLEGLVDKDKERERISKEIAAKEKDLERVVGKLGNEGFTSKAPPAVIEKETAKRDELNAGLQLLRERLAALV